MDDEESRDEDSEEDNEDGDDEEDREGDVDLAIDTTDPDAGEIDPVFVSDLDALHRINDAIQAEKANTSSTLLPFLRRGIV